MKKIIFALFLSLLLTSFVSAYEIIKVDPSDSIEKNFIMSGLKDYVAMNPGDSVTKNLEITNRFGKSVKFKLEVKNMVSSNNTKEDSITLTDDDSNPYSLKKFITPEVNEFTLGKDEKIILPVIISIPEGTRPGGLYGAVVVSALPDDKADGDNSKTKLVPGIAHNYYIKVNGDNIIEDGLLTQFKTNKSFYEKGPVQFDIIFENNGSVHLSPNGTITIKNILGSTIDEINIDPYFVLPDAVKLKTIDFDKKNLMGRYTAEIKLNRGYTDKEDTTDIATVSFWVLPWKMLAIVLVAIILLIWLITAFVAQYKLALLKRK